MTKNELKREVFSRSWAGRLAVIFEWTMLSAIMSILAVFLLNDLLIIEKNKEFFKMILTAMMAASVIMGICVGSQIPISVVFWRILPLNKKAAQKFIAKEKQELEKKISKRDELVKAAKENCQNKILAIDSEIEQNKDRLRELDSLENSL